MAKLSKAKLAKFFESNNLPRFSTETTKDANGTAHCSRCGGIGFTQKSAVLTSCDGCGKLYHQS